MARMACVELPAFPLQLLLKRHPDWADRPVVVVANLESDVFDGDPVMLYSGVSLE